MPGKRSGPMSSSGRRAADGNDGTYSLYSEIPMDNALADSLAEQWRDALSAYVIHHVLMKTSPSSALNLGTADHLDRYLMTDTQVSSRVTTSYLAEALACTQTYLNAIFNNIEPGYDNAFPPALIAFWQNAMSNYSVWAAYQMLEDYPENYIRADLRLDRTQLFQALENQLAQARISEASVQQALLHYLNQYEYQNSIRVQAGYVDYRNGYQDQKQFSGYTFANSDYYLLGKDTATPARYYWRKVKVRLDQQSTFIQPDAWSEWQAIAMPATHTVIQACLVLLCGRLQLVWLHHDAPVEVNDSAQKRCTLKLETIYLGLDGQWSSPETLWSRVEDFAEAEPTLPDYRLLALAVAGARNGDDQLFAAVGTFTSAELASIECSVQRDVLKRQASADSAFDETMQQWLFGYFYPHSSAARLGLQRRVSSTEWDLESVEAGTPHDPYTELEALYERRGNNRLHLRCRHSEARNAEQVVALHISGSWRTQFLGRLYVDVYTNGLGGLEWRCRLITLLPLEQVKLSHEGMADVILHSADFKRVAAGYYEARKSVDLGPLNDALAAATESQVISGAGFSITHAGTERQNIANESNFITTRPEPVVYKDVSLLAGQESLWRGSFTLNGAATTGWVTYDWPTTSDDNVEVTLQAGSDVLSTFTVTRATYEANEEAPYIARQSSGTDFLVIDSVGEQGKPLAARLNSQHVPDLINRAQVSPQTVFAWDAQHLREPAYVEGASGGAYGGWQRTADDPLMNLYDANGLYLRELFFHVPHLIATRLQEEERFEEARRWLGLVFDPQQKLQPSETPAVAYWNCAWLLKDDVPAAGIEHQLIDPHVIALHAPSHYRKAVFMQYVALLVGEADLHYRRQTRDSLANAWLLYRMAADLMGEAPNARAIDTWQPRTVEQLLNDDQGKSLPETLAIMHKPADLPKALSTFFWAGVAAHPAFRLPVNRQLLDTWQLLDQRFHNLRHFLTLEGAVMQLPLYAPAANPFELLLARMGGQANLPQLMGYRTVVPPFRFSTLMAKAHEVVSTLMQFGDRLRDYLEHEERTDLEALQYQQAMDIAGYTLGVQEQLYLQQQKSEGVLAAQRDATAVRQTHYTRLYQDNLNAEEMSAMSLYSVGRALSVGANASFGAAYMSELGPNIFGMANGGMQYKGPLMLVGYGLESASSASLTASELTRELAGYRRRREEWQLQVRLADKELSVLDRQLEVQKHATLAAHNALQHSQKLMAQARQLHDFYQNKATSVSLYRWLRAQATAWHTTLFSVAVDLCNSAEACLQFETGNYDHQIIRPTVWAADRLGLNAAGNLKLELHRLEAEALLRHERHFELRKTVSLQALIEERLVFDKDGQPITDWQVLRDTLKKDGELAFSLSETLFNKDYPGHYLRRLHSVALSLPALLGPYQNIRATLTQKISRLLTRPDIEGVKFLTPGLPEAIGPGQQDNVMMSLRPQQQVCLSTAIQDSGLFTAAQTDDRYLPFEGTGAVSEWHLRFPRHTEQAELIEGMSDIIVDVFYFALHGGELFERAVEDVLAELPARQPLAD